MPRTILVTGATGFIAKHIVLQLLDAGYEVRGAVRSLERAGEVSEAVRPHLADPDAFSRLNFVALDLEKDEGWREAMSGIDALIHTASPFPMKQPRNEQEVIRPAVDGTLRALRAASASVASRLSPLAVSRTARSRAACSRSNCRVALRASRIRRAPSQSPSATRPSSAASAAHDSCGAALLARSA